MTSDDEFQKLMSDFFDDMKEIHDKLMLSFEDQTNKKVVAYGYIGTGTLVSSEGNTVSYMHAIDDEELFKIDAGGWCKINPEEIISNRLNSLGISHSYAYSPNNKPKKYGDTFKIYVVFHSTEDYFMAKMIYPNDIDEV